jgi:hypothetical protein
VAARPAGRPYLGLGAPRAQGGQQVMHPSPMHLLNPKVLKQGPLHPAASRMTSSSSRRPLTD